MHIFLDESGVFAGIGEPVSLSAMAALVVPDGRLSRVKADWRKLRRTFPKDHRGEVKGKALSEEQVIAVALLLSRHRCIAEVSMIDMGLHKLEEIEAHIEGQLHGMSVNLTNEHHPNIWATIERLQTTLSAMKAPQYVQAVMILDLLHRVLDHAKLYYVQRTPAELGNFSWVFDAKGDNSIKNTWEEWWTTLLGPILQSSSMRKPSARLVGANYRAFENRYCTDEWPDHLPEREPDAPPAMEITKVFQDTRFSSEAEAGLELADIVANAIRRTVAGRLDKRAWGPLARLFIARRQHCIHLIALNGEMRADPVYSGIVRAFGKGGRSMIPEHVRRRDDAPGGARSEGPLP